MSNLNYVEVLWTIFALWGMIRGFQVASLHYSHRRLLHQSKQNGVLQLVASMGVGRSTVIVVVESLFFITGVLAGFTPPRSATPFTFLRIMSIYSILVAAGLLALWQEIELRLYAALKRYQERIPGVTGE